MFVFTFILFSSAGCENIKLDNIGSANILTMKAVHTSRVSCPSDTIESMVPLSKGGGCLGDSGKENGNENAVELIFVAEASAVMGQQQHCESSDGSLGATTTAVKLSLNSVVQAGGGGGDAVAVKAGPTEDAALAKMNRPQKFFTGGSSTKFECQTGYAPSLDSYTLAGIDEAAEESIESIENVALTGMNQQREFFQADRADVSITLKSAASSERGVRIASKTCGKFFFSLSLVRKISNHEDWSTECLFYFYLYFFSR